MAYITSGMGAEDRKDFMEELYAEQGAEDTAKDMLRERMKSLGIEWDGEL